MVVVASVIMIRDSKSSIINTVCNLWLQKINVHVFFLKTRKWSLRSWLWLCPLYHSSTITSDSPQTPATISALKWLHRVSCRTSTVTATAPSRTPNIYPLSGTAKKYCDKVSDKHDGRFFHIWSTPGQSLQCTSWKRLELKTVLSFFGAAPRSLISTSSWSAYR